MDNFDKIGNAYLLAHEGQRQIAAALVRGIRRAMLGLLDLVGRHLPQGARAPW